MTLNSWILCCHACIKKNKKARVNSDLVIRMSLCCAPTEGSSKGEVSWEFNWSHTHLRATSAHVVFQHTTFENGCVDWKVCTGDVCVNGSKGMQVQVIQKNNVNNKTYLYF